MTAVRHVRSLTSHATDSHDNGWTLAQLLLALPLALGMQVGACRSTAPLPRQLGVHQGMLVPAVCRACGFLSHRGAAITGGCGVWAWAVHLGRA
jgi:hypothetical protein